MAQRRRSSVPPAVEEVRERIEEWRSTRPKRSSMPEPLWSMAVALAQEHGVYGISQALRLNYENLKVRLATTPKSADGSAARRELMPSFVELALPTAASSAVVEVFAADGAKLTIRVVGRDLDVGDLVRRFRDLRS